MINQENFTPINSKTTTTRYDYHVLLQKVAEAGKVMFGRDFMIEDADIPVITRLMCYFLKDEAVARVEKIDLNKGLLLMGPIGCGKTSLMKIMSNYCASKEKPVFSSCNAIVMEFNRKGYESIEQYTKGSFLPYAAAPKVYCFDDLGVERIGHHYGASSNVMAEILLSRYNYFTSRKMITHITTNLNALELDAIYGNRLCSRMREMFNQIIFSNTSMDKRK